MPNFIVDPITGIQIPTPGVDPGEDYAVNVSNSLQTLAHLTHTGAANLDGYQIPSAGINFNADLSAQSNNLTNLRSTRFISNSSNLNGVGDINCVNVVSGNLWFNNGSGAPVQITAGGILDVTTSNQWPSISINANYTINASDGYIFFDVNTAGNARTLTLPLASSVPFGRLYVVKDHQGDAATHNITINPFGSDTIDTNANYVIINNFGAVALVSDGINNWNLLKYSQNVYGSGEFVTFNSGSNLNINNGADVNLNNGSTLIAASGSDVAFDTGSTLLIQSGTSVSATLSGGGLGIISNAVGAISSTHSLGIYTGVASGIATGAAGGITTSVAGGFSSTTNKAFNLGGDGYDVITYGTAHTVNRLIFPFSTGLPANWTLNSSYGTPTTSASTTNSINIPLTPYLIQGSTLLTVTLMYSVVSHSALPSQQLRFDVRGTQYSNSPNLGGGIYPIPQDFSWGGAGSLIGPVNPNAANVTAYVNGGNQQLLTYNLGYPSGGGIVIDKTYSNYYLWLTDENGTNYAAGNVFWGFWLHMTNITDMTIP